MRKELLEKAFESAMKNKAAFIAVQIETEGNEKPELIINPYENYQNKLDYFRNAYDENLRLKSAAAAGKLINITAVASGDKLEEIEWQLCESIADWKALICGAIDDAIKKIENAEITEEDRENIKFMREAVKELFINTPYTPAQKRFMCEHIEEYRELFEICVDGDQEEFKHKLYVLSEKMNLC